MDNIKNYSYSPSVKVSTIRNVMVPYLLLFIIWPFGTLLYALYYYYRRESWVIFVLFTALFGYSMIAESTGTDLYRVLNYLQNYASLSYEDIINVLQGFYSTAEDSSADIYKDIITFFVSRFTTNGKWLMIIFGLFYGYAFIKSLSVFLVYSKTNKFQSAVVLICFSFIFSLDQLAGIRYATAAYIFFYGAIKFLITLDKKYLWIVLIAALVHFSYLSLIGVFGLYLLVKKQKRLIYVILTISFIIPNLIEPYMMQFSDFLGSAIQNRVNMYYGIKGSTIITEGRLSWYVALREEGMLYYTYFFLIYTRLNLKHLFISNLANSIFFLSLLILSLANFTQSIPHAGYRYQFVYLMFAIFYLYLIYMDNITNKNMNMLVLSALPFFSLQIFYALRTIFTYSSPMLYIGNLPLILTDNSSQSIWSFIFN